MASNQSSLVSMAFKAITDGRNNDNTADCQTAIIIITDRQITSDTAEVVASGNRNIQSMYKIVPAKLFVTSLTDDVNGYHDATALQLTCDHSGIWTKVLFVCLCVCHYIYQILLVMTLIMYVYSHYGTSVCVHLCVRTCECICVHASVYLCVCVHACICVFVCVHTSVCV